MRTRNYKVETNPALNNSTAKQLFSFSKESRFKEFKPQQIL